MAKQKYKEMDFYCKDCKTTSKVILIDGEKPECHKCMKKKIDKMYECKNCKELIAEVEELRKEICEITEGYSRISEKLWIISHKKRAA